MKKIWWNCFYHLVKKEVLIFSKEFFSKFIDVCILLFTTVVIFAYCMPFFGLAVGYGEFILVGAIASFSFFEIVGRTSILVTDILGDKTISYYLVLPLPATYVFCSIAVSWALCSSFLAIFLFPLGKILLSLTSLRLP